MTTATLRLCKKNLDSPDNVRGCDHGRMESVHFGDTTLTRVTLQPGWKWSEHVRPMVHTDTCQAQHIQYVISGRLRVRMDDGEQLDLAPGDFVIISPGHDAWVIGDEPFVAVDFSPDMKTYAQPSGEEHP